MTNKMTKKDWFAVLAQMVDASDYEDKEGAKAFIAHEVDLLGRKSGKSTMTKIQKENVSIMDTIKEVLTDFGKAVTISELMTDARLSSYSNQKLSALVRQLVKAGEVTRTEDKKKAYFSIAEK